MHSAFPLGPANVDYEELTDVPVVFAPGVSTQIVNLTTLTNPVVQGNRTLTATITTTQSGVDITVAQSEITIVETVGMLYSLASCLGNVIHILLIPLQLYNENKHVSLDSYNHHNLATFHYYLP